jgi:hypothetical protein
MGFVGGEGWGGGGTLGTRCVGWGSEVVWSALVGWFMGLVGAHVYVLVLCLSPMSQLSYICSSSCINCGGVSYHSL